MQIEIPMGHHNALRVGRRPRGVEQLGKIVILDIRRREIGSGGTYQSLVVFPVAVGFDRYVMPDRRSLIAHSVDDWLKIPVVKHGDRIGVIKNKSDFSGGEPYVERQ